MRLDPHLVKPFDYHNAVQWYDTLKPWRDAKELGAARPTEKHRKRYLTARIDADKTFAIRYHDTDVVRIKPDNTFELRTGGYNTLSTAAAIHAFTPPGVSCNMIGRKDDNGQMLLSVDGQVYNFDSYCTLHQLEEYKLFANSRCAYYVDQSNHEDFEILSLDAEKCKIVRDRHPWLKRLRKIHRTTKIMGGIPNWQRFCFGKQYRPWTYTEEPSMDIAEAVEFCQRGDFIRPILEAGPNVVKRIELYLYSQAEFSCVKTTRRPFLNDLWQYQRVQYFNKLYASL